MRGVWAEADVAGVLAARELLVYKAQLAVFSVELVGGYSRRSDAARFLQLVDAIQPSFAGMKRYKGRVFKRPTAIFIPMSIASSILSSFARPSPAFPKAVP